MEAKKIRFASILLGLVMALCLAPGFAFAEGSGLQTAESGKPSQAIQAAYLPSFTTDTGKNLNAKVVEGNGALSYAVKSGGDCVSVDSNGALTFKKAGEAIITVTAAATNEYAETSIDVPITIYDHFDYTFTVGNTLDCVDYYGHYPINKLEIKLKGWENVLGSGTINNPQPGSKTTIRATGFAKRIELRAEIQMVKRTQSASETINLNGGGRFEIQVNSRGRIVMCDYGITLPEPDYVAPVAKPNLSSTGQNQLLIYPGSVLSGGQHMEYAFGTEEGPNPNGWTDNYGFMRAKDPGDYYVWWKTASRDRGSLMYFSGGRLDTAPQCVKVTIGKGNINPTVSIDGWTYGETAKTPTVTGNTGNGVVTYEYKAKDADDGTYTTTVPKNAGDYTVRAAIAETTTHSSGTATADFTIAKATLQPQDVRVVGYMSTNDSKQTWETSITQSLASMMPANAGNLTYTAGTSSYKIGESVQALPDGFTFTPTVSSTGEVSATLEITNKTAEAIDQVGEIVLPVKVESQKNYNDATINVVVMPTARTVQAVTIAGVPDSKTKIFGDVPFTLTATVKDNGTVVDTKKGDWYWYSSDPNVLEVPPVTSSYSASNEIPVTVKGPGSAQIMAWYEPSGGTTIGAAVTDSITVDKASISPSVSIDGWTYGGTPNVPSVSGNPGNGAPTYEYKAADADDSTYTAAVPTLPGGYTVRATVPETDNYKAGTCTAGFAIAKKPITATVTAHDKTYDGTTNATVTATVEKSDLVESDLDSAALVEDGKMAIAGVTCTFEDKNAGENKAVFLNYDNVTSPVANADSYEVTIAATPTAAIAPLAVNVGAADKSSPYGEAIAELTYGLYGPNGLVEGDTLESLGVTATTEATSTSNVGYYPIKLSVGTGNSNYKVTLGGDATYTITKADPVVTKAPEAANPTYSGSPQALVTAGTVEGGEIQYSLDGETFSANMPVGTDAGDYAVWYKVVGDANHNDTAPQQLATTIAKATIPPQAVRVMERVQSVDSPSAHWEVSFEQSLAGMMPGYTGALTYTPGTPRYKNGETTLPDGVTSFTSDVDSNGMVTAKLEIPSSAEDIPANAQEITVPVTVKSEKNYEDAVINVVMVPTKKKEMAVAISGVPKSVTYGDGPFTLTATATEKETGAVVNTNNGNWYWYSSDPSVLEVASLQGSNEMSVTVKKSGSAQIMAWYEPSSGDTIGAAVTDSITVNKAEFTPSVTIAGWTYGGAANAPVVSGNTSGGAVAYSYSGTTAGGAPFGPSAAPPTQAGSYIVTATVAETANYEGATCTAGFAVAKRGITATVTAEDKTYDGTADATVSATVDANDLAPSDLGKDTPVEGGKVEIPGLAGTFADKNVGEDKAVGLDYSGVVSPVAKPANYDVTISRAPTATITPRPVSVNADDKSSPYGAEIAELTYSLGDGTTLAEGDDLASLDVKASTTATSSSPVGEYPITLSGGTRNPNYAVTLGEDATYTITAADISKATVTLAEKSYVYDGKAKEPAAKVAMDGRTLVAGTDYELFYSNNTEVGTATATVTGRGNYQGSAEATFAIAEDSAPVTGGVTMHRLYNPNSGEHFFTASAYERDAVVAAGWTYEGPGWTAPESGDPVYRLYNPNAGEHHYTRSEYERDHLVSLGWSDEGRGWYSAGDDGVPLLRVYNPNAFANNHHYTASAAERDWLVSLGWKDEGTGWYGL